MLPLERLKNLNTKDNLWIYILALLKKKQVHGWKLQALIEEEFGFKPGKITPYRVLYRLEKAGLVESEKKEKRRNYKITRKGREELKKAKGFYQNILKNIFV